LVLDRSGYLWVELGPSVASRTPSIDFLVFDPSGALLGTVTVPPLQVLEVGDDYLIGIDRDDLGVERVYVHEILKSAPLDNNL
jgi:hypothetical protein